jgi:NADPH:quinone reductase-like Zn-dependent oxidoreductase
VPGWCDGSFAEHASAPEDQLAAKPANRTAEDRRTVLGLLTGIHGARAAAPDADDFVVPDLDELKMMMGETAQP